MHSANPTILQCYVLYVPVSSFGEPLSGHGVENYMSICVDFGYWNLVFDIVMKGRRSKILILLLEI